MQQDKFMASRQTLPSSQSLLPFGASSVHHTMRRMIDVSRLEVYTPEFYQSLSARSLQSARIIVPLFLRYFQVASVIDIGCGIGTWLRAFVENNVSEVTGIDGPHIDKATLMVDKVAFITQDLSAPLTVQHRYDVAVSLEVAEHLPDHRANSFIKDLTDAAPVVLFSAAVPGQPGIEHINPQWQDYWRAIFADYGYAALDLVRPAIWGSAHIDYWYQQNTIVYCDNTVIIARPDLRCVSDKISLNIVHPDLYQLKAQDYKEDIERLSQPNQIPRLALNAVRRALHPLRLRQ
jgi:SAM-dependent methyltransferase